MDAFLTTLGIVAAILIGLVVIRLVNRWDDLIHLARNRSDYNAKRRSQWQLDRVESVPNPTMVQLVITDGVIEKSIGVDRADLLRDVAGAVNPPPRYNFGLSESSG